MTTPFYPVMLDLRDRPCVVLGGGAEAEAKVRGLLAAGARVTLIAATASENLARWAAAGRIRWLRRAYRPGDLAGFVLAIAATGDPDLNRRIRREADRHRLWLNAVDDPPHCSFILPAVHRQGDLVVAIGTGGKSPALAARLRDWLAGRLGPEYAVWLQLLGEMRPLVTRRVPDPGRRKALWYRMVDSAGLDLVRRGDVEGARRLLQTLLDEEAGSPDPVVPARHPLGPPGNAPLSPVPGPSMGPPAGDPAGDPAGGAGSAGWGQAGSPGTVYLVGAGPGDPELLTLRAARILAAADCVLYDRLVAPAILARVRPGAECIPVGKAPRPAAADGAAGSAEDADRPARAAGPHPGAPEVDGGWSQEAILRLLVDRARRHRVVVRLKGGDPMVFGRGGEELAYLRRHGIPVEVVPGVTSAVAVPALVGIPLTYRGVASSFTVASGHCQGGTSQDWRRLAAADTLVVLMGVAQRQAIARSLIEAGRPPSEPCAFVERGTWPEERVVRTTLAEVAAGAVQVQAPAVWVIGPVAALADPPSPRPAGDSDPARTTADPAIMASPRR
ncbi:uroporphyrin-III C-methyltransferase [Thermaerobacter marianensis DSM 12885]|uniref:Uroporphyrin-III C-methyltransferase n=1 Tax=Thermaerobacter marianensis (strain ATCC 700841 / DSM 12885 / JCM 10246 / 7p75a) TaxID=644966 RepID=E6SH74_THEM7|nr:uroporphyrinogen-III C-methyltransferase [Thermaerobacter marianensis]ADU51738.1 uroporphyrin-III C-methyltransferase [Thermaerobacter marianensis DSM 12885]